MAREPELHKWKLREGYSAQSDPRPGVARPFEYPYAAEVRAEREAREHGILETQEASLADRAETLVSEVERRLKASEVRTSALEARVLELETLTLPHLGMKEPDAANR